MANAVTDGGTAAFDHTPAAGEGETKEKAGEAGGNNPLEQGDLIAGKFTSQEELVKAYNALQAKLGGKPPVPEDKPKVEEKPTEELADTKGLIEKAKDAGIDFNALNAEFADKGELSPETMTTLTKRGIPQEMVEAYIQGQKALVAGAVDTLAALTGGKEGLQRTLDWAAANLPEAEIDVYNTAMKTGNVALTTSLLRGISAAYTADVGEAPANVVGASGSPAGTVPFANDAEMNLAMADPKYRKDSGYRDSVIARIAAGM